MDETGGHGSRRTVGARTLGFVVVAVVVTATAVAVYADRHSFVESLRRVGAVTMLASFLVGTVAVAATCPVWRSVVVGLGVDIPRAPAARVFFATQLGKYVPGAVWPIVLQTQAGRRYGAGRRTMLTAGALSLVIGCSTGLLLACLLLPFSDSGALSRYWYALLLVPLLVALLHPRSLPLVVDRVMRVLRRPPLGERLDPVAELRACGWNLVSWAASGAQLAILCAGLGKHGWGVVVLCVGAMGLAVSLGVLFIPAPAGAGIREVVLTLALTTLLRAGPALAVVVASRVLSVAADVTLAAVAVAVVRSPQAAVE